MPDLQQVVSLVVAGILGGIGLWWSRRGLRKAGVGNVSSTTIANLRELAESWEAKFDLVTEELTQEREAHATTTALLLDEQRETDRCQRQLNGALDELRQVGRRRTPRTQRPRL